MTHRVAGTSISVMTKLFLALVLTTVAGSASDGQCGTNLLPSVRAISPTGIVDHTYKRRVTRNTRQVGPILGTLNHTKEVADTRGSPNPGHSVYFHAHRLQGGASVQDVARALCRSDQPRSRLKSLVLDLSVESDCDPLDPIDITDEGYVAPKDMVLFVPCGI